MAIPTSISSDAAMPLIMIFLAIIIIIYLAQLQQRRRLPPGPKPLPIIGNLFDLAPSTSPEYKHWLQHKDLYGPISSVTALGATLVLIHDQQAAHELLEKTSLKTSGRPWMLFAHKLCGFDNMATMQGYTDRFRAHRRLIHEQLGTEKRVSRFEGVHETEVNRQLVRTLREPERWLNHLRKTAGATILRMTYGYSIEPSKPDRLVGIVEQTMKDASVVVVPMSWLVDLIPALQYLPEGFPGSAFKKIARRMNSSLHAVGLIPYRFVRRQMSTLSHRPSYVSELVEQYQQAQIADKHLNPNDEDAIIWSAAVMFVAGSDTTVIAMTAFTLAMLLFPEVQRKAKEEIDRVVGSSRLPGFEDRHNLPYIDALVKEVLRWWPIGPMGLVHQADEDIEYRGLLIPKGANLLPSVWWFLHDPAVYADPDIFDPERFLDPRNEPHPNLHSFGYGRRICPGRIFADSSLYLNIARSLAVFEFEKAVDANGRTIDVNVQGSYGLLNKPTEFKVQVRPRSSQHTDLINRLEADGLFEEGDAAYLDTTVG